MLKVKLSHFTIASCLIAVMTTANAKDIIHDAEQAILEKQFGDKWAKQDIGINKKLSTLEKEFGKKPNIIHIMWDDNSFGEVGIPALNQVRGYDTPNITQPLCTKST